MTRHLLRHGPYLNPEAEVDPVRAIRDSSNLALSILPGLEDVIEWGDVVTLTFAPQQHLHDRHYQVDIEIDKRHGRTSSDNGQD